MYSNRAAELSLDAEKMTQSAGNAAIQKIRILNFIFSIWPVSGESIWAYKPSYLIGGNASDRWILWQRIGPFYPEFPNSTPSWQPCYTYLLLYLLLWLGIYCFKLKFKTIVQLNILNFEKFIFRPSLGNKIQISTPFCCCFPSGTRFHYFILFSTDFQ